MTRAAKSWTKIFCIGAQLTNQRRTSFISSPRIPICLSFNSQQGLVTSTISKREHKCFDIEAYFRNKSKTFWFGPLIIGFDIEAYYRNESKPFSLIQNNPGPGVKKAPDPGSATLGKKFWFGPEIVSGKAECFYLIQKTYRSNQNFLIWFKIFLRKQIVLAWKFFDEAKQFDLVRELQYLSYVSERFYFIQKLKDHSKNNSLFSKNWRYQNDSQCFCDDRCLFCLQSHQTL